MLVVVLVVVPVVVVVPLCRPVHVLVRMTGRPGARHDRPVHLRAVQHRERPLQERSHPCPRRAEVNTTSTPGLTRATLARNAASSNSAAAARSAFVTSTRLASPKAVGYLSGLSSPR